MDSATDLICLSYCSRSAFGGGPDCSSPEINRILAQSRRNNQEQEIGGVLYSGAGFFFQYLEGPADAVDRLYAVICRDDRHFEVLRLTRRPIRSRRFSGWSMKCVTLERMVDQVIRRHGLNEFDPYRFTPALIDDLVVSFTCAPEATAFSDADSTSQPPGGARSLLTRLFNSLFY